MRQLQRISIGLLFVVLGMIPACMDDARTTEPPTSPRASESDGSQSQSSGPAEQDSPDVSAAACTPDLECQPIGAHCCSGERLFAPLQGCEGPGHFSGYVCGHCIPTDFCQPTGDHCCSASHAFIGILCGGSLDGKQYSGYKCN